MLERIRNRERIVFAVGAFALGCLIPLAVWALNRAPGAIESRGDTSVVEPAESAEAAQLIDRLAELGYEVEPRALDSAEPVATVESPQADARPAPAMQRPTPRTAEPTRTEPPYREPVRDVPAAPSARQPAGEAPAPEPRVDVAAVPEAPSTVIAVVPRGRVLSVELSEPVSSRTAEPGQRFGLRLAETLYLPEGVTVPAGSLLTGRVREVERAKRPQKPGRLVLAAESLEVGGRRFALAAPLSADGDAVKGRGSHEEDAGRIGIGAAAGTILGAIIGGKKGAIAGLVLGGGGVFLATRGEDVELPAGALLTAQLEQDLELELPAR